MKNEFDIQFEINRIFEIAQNENFIYSAIDICKKIGISADEFNNNKAAILLKFAHEVRKTEVECGQLAF